MAQKMGYEKQGLPVEVMDVSDSRSRSGSTNIQSPRVPTSNQAHPKQSLWEGLRTHTRLSLWGIFISSVAICMGYEMVFVGGITTVPAFTAVYGIPVTPPPEPTSANPNPDPNFVAAMWISLWAVSHPLGAAIGSLLGGYAQDKIGRKYTIGIATVWQAACITICFLSDHASTVDARGGVYFAGKVLQGMGIGALMAAAHTYISEVLPPSLKGSITSLIAPFGLLGQVFGSVAVKIANNGTGPSAYRKAIAGQWITTILPLLVFLLIPESPVYSLRRGKPDAARSACNRLQGQASRAVDDLFTRITDMIALQDETKVRTQNVTYSDLFKKRSDARRTLVIFFIMAVPQLMGLPILGHANIIAVTLGMQAAKAASFVIIGAVLGLIAAFLAFGLLARVGRRTVLLSSVGVVTVLWFLMGIAGLFRDKNSIAVANAVVAIFMIIVFFLSLGAWPVSYAIAGETSSLPLRAKSQGVAWASSQLSTGIIAVFSPFLYNQDAANLGGKIGFVFFAFSVSCLVIAYLFVPETKGLDVEEVDRVYEGPAVVIGKSGMPTLGKESSGV